MYGHRLQIACASNKKSMSILLGARMMKIRHAMVSKERRMGEGSLCLMGHGIKEPIRWSTISLGLYHYPMKHLLWLIHLQLAEFLKIKCASHTNWEIFTIWPIVLGVYIGKVKKLKVVKHVQSKSFNFTFW